MRYYLLYGSKDMTMIERKLKTRFDGHRVWAKFNNRILRMEWLFYAGKFL